MASTTAPRAQAQARRSPALEMIAREEGFDDMPLGGYAGWRAN